MLAGMAQWTKRLPANHGVAGSIPSQGTCLDCMRPMSPRGAAQEATTH